MDPLLVELPCCPVCGRIGKLPVNHFGGKSLCGGPVGNSHRRVSMKPRLFREVVESELKEALRVTGGHRGPGEG